MIKVTADVPTAVTYEAIVEALDSSADQTVVEAEAESLFPDLRSSGEF